MPRVIALGSINMDILSTMQRVPRAGETVNGDTVALMPGGKGLNQAVAAVQQGAAVSFVGRVGDDAFGGEIIDFLSAKGIDTARIRRSATKPTANAIILVDATGENRIVVIPAANTEIAVPDADGLEFAPGDVVVSQFEIPRTTIATLFARARAAGARTVLNAAPALDDAPDSLWPDVDILVVNETELGHFARVDLDGNSTEVSLIVAARMLLRRDGQVVVATLGARGALAVTATDQILVPGRPVTPVDTTGAGDCFVGCLCARLAAGDGLQTALRYANAGASIAVTRIGTGTAMPMADEVWAVV